MKTLLAAILLVSTTVSADPPGVYHDGKYLGDLSANEYAPNSVANPYGRYGNRYSADSINNEYGRYGSEYSQDSVNNPYAQGKSYDLPKLPELPSF